MKDKILIQEKKNIGSEYISNDSLPKGKDEYYLRNKQQIQSSRHWRSLRVTEVEALVKNGNIADDWDIIFVRDLFEPALVRNCSFHGMVRLGNIQHATLCHHDLEVPVGLTNSQIISCDIGDMSAIHNVHYLSHYIIGDSCILTNIDEMNMTNHAKFGNGILKDGEDESVLTWMDIMNETGSRKILPFDGMIPADAYIWARYRHDTTLMDRLKTITLRHIDKARGYYGEVGDQTVIKNTRIIKDTKIGSMCYIKGANKLKNITINSSSEAPTQIGEGVEVVNGIVGYGCRIFYGCKAVRFIMGENSNLKYGGRLINSFLGSNSTISCCEVLNNLIFPSHEQHHNNSFLVAALVKGQSNIAAGATVGSNHNSRANDNEIKAGRGFWPGLCTSIKHPSTFASFTLMAKGSYPSEVNIYLPFSLVNNNVSKDQLEIMPAFWWLYNMYAMARNEWKYLNRDKRIYRVQNIEYAALAPDTGEEIIDSLDLLEHELKLQGHNREEIAFTKEDIANNYPDRIYLNNASFERSKRVSVILKPFKGYQAYLQMLFYYSMEQIMVHLTDQSKESLYVLGNTDKKREKEWINLGGQLIPGKDVNTLFLDIKSQDLNSWDNIHKRYDELFRAYPKQKLFHAIAVLKDVFNIKILNNKDLKTQLERYGMIHDLITKRVYSSRAKDYKNHFKQLNFESSEEMDAVLGKIDDNGFIVSKKRENKKIHKQIDTLVNGL
ncbi:MAG: DUF4954 domain-containing protein [Candidatus Neomarinimicrobiota bacterium]|nr:MAG: DUF4954 domain-containing protein [Candidatus Neomarinimicrobiota bacterium]